MYKVELVQRFKTDGKLIEIGPASGGFSLLAKDAGFEVTAIEMNHLCCSFLEKVVGVSVIESTDELASLESADPADVIALWHVIEHLRAPWDLIRIAASKLRPGGILVLAAPNPRSLQFRLLGPRWVHIDAPRHVMLPSPEFIARVAEEHGLQVALLTTRDKGSLGWNKFGWQFLLANPFQSRFLRRIAGMVGKIIAWVMTPLEAREGAGTAFTIVLKKRSA